LHDALRARATPTADHAAVAAAVAVVLRHATNDTEALLIRRSTHEHDPWSGHMAFPGGKRHSEDASLLHTALRETREEVGLDLGTGADLLGSLAPLEAMARGEPAGFTITPFVFLLSEPSELQLDTTEVDEALWVPLDRLCRGEQQTLHRYQRGEVRMELPAFDLGGHVVWGLTHRMLVSLLDLARA
jgi:8-oxo-dGTP pyrophosphatase MutT (NUDIX family)